MSTEEQPPTLRIVRGVPTAEETAALVVVLSAASGGEAPDEPGGHGSQWAPPTRLMRPAMSPSGWWESALPR